MSKPENDVQAVAKAERPAHCTEAMLEYLDDLRESGKTNMFGARPYVQKKFRLTNENARDVLLYWMKSFSERHPQ